MSNKNIKPSQLKKPKLRFKEFSDAWNEMPLSSLFMEVTETVGKRDIETYSITAGKGFVSQKEKFGKNISGKQNSKYIVLESNDFAYNKGNSKSYKYGCVYPNYENKQIAVPNVFICFKLRDSSMDVNFFAKLFESHCLDRGLRRIISSTARMDGLLNVSSDSFYKLKISYPSILEQKKISNFLDTVHDWISILIAQKKQLELYKKGVLRDIFSQKIRFKDADGSSFIEWKSVRVGNIVEEYIHKSTRINQHPILSSSMRGISLQSDYFNHEVASKNNIGYKVVPKGYFTYRSMSDTGNFTFNLQLLVDIGIVSPAYPVFNVVGDLDSQFLYYYLNNSSDVKNSLMSLRQGGTRFALSFKRFSELKILLPQIEEQRKIAQFLTSLDDLIKLKHDQIELAVQWKKGLMQNLFV